MTIKVASIFEKGALKPVWFIHDGRKYAVKEICYKWTTRNGASKVYHFAVSDGSNTFEISFDDKEMTWEKYYETLQPFEHKNYTFYSMILAGMISSAVVVTKAIEQDAYAAAVVGGCFFLVGGGIAGLILSPILNVPIGMARHLIWGLSSLWNDGLRPKYDILMESIAEQRFDEAVQIISDLMTINREMAIEYSTLMPVNIVVELINHVITTRGKIEIPKRTIATEPIIWTGRPVWGKETIPAYMDYPGYREAAAIINTQSPERQSQIVTMLGEIAVADINKYASSRPPHITLFM